MRGKPTSQYVIYTFHSGEKIVEFGSPHGGEMQNVPTLVSIGSRALDESSPFQPRNYVGDSGSIEIKPLAQVSLTRARILPENVQHTELHARDVC